ncbi:MAG: PIG-L family deacetylase [Actinobacteria bacterium]|nr:PIG-L family deacetylase [Actinomycetota bacterium]
MGRRLAALFAHPDDDVFSLGGTLALHAEELDLLAVYATSGEAGLIADPSLANQDTLGAVREAEARAALELLGVSGPEVHFLGHPDGGLAGVDEEELAGTLAGLLAGFDPEVVVTFGPDGVTGHPDHVAIHRAATEAFHRAGAPGRLLYVALPASELARWEQMLSRGEGEGFDPDDPLRPRGVPDEEIAVTVDCSPVWRRKVEAIRAHRTQSAELEGIPEDAYPAIFGQEHFTQAFPSHHGDPHRLTHVFVGP